MAITYVFDIDGTICNETHGEYEHCRPRESVIESIRILANEGCRIIFHTARGQSRLGITINQLNNWGVPYHDLIMGKPKGDYYVDRNALRPEEI